MLPSRFLLLILLISFSSQGTGRMVIMRDLSESESGLWINGRGVEEMVVMDYKEPGANTNPRAGLPPSPPKP